jgi:hypothetical protein
LLPVCQELKQIAEHTGSGSFMELVFSGIAHFHTTPQAVNLFAFLLGLIDLNNLQVRKTVIAIPAQLKIIFYFSFAMRAGFHNRLFLYEGEM